MTADADAASIRAAYRDLARIHHPDRGADANEMTAINEAYRVLADPGRRLAYDRQLAAGRASTGSAATSSRRPYEPVGEWPEQRPPDLQPARIPWRSMALLATVGVVVVLVGAALIEPAEQEQPDGLLRPGSCVAIEPNGDAREVTCDEDADDLVVRQLVPLDARCPGGTTPYRDRQGLGTACVVGPATG